MTNFEYFSLFINTVTSLAIVVTVIYAALQFKRTAIIHEQNLEWSKRIETSKKLDDYNRLDSALFLNKKFKLIGRKHPLSVDVIKKVINEDSKVAVHVNRLLNYYEALAIGIENNIYDEIFIKSTRRGAMIRTFISFEDYIKYDRKEGNKPLTYIKYEKLIKKWVDEEYQEQGLPILGNV